MKTIFVKKYRKYLFWLGPALVLMGLSAGVTSGSWGPVPLGLLIFGIVFTGTWLLFQAYKSKWWGRRSTQAGSNALVATLSVFLILGLVNFLGTRYSTRVDFTENQLFTLAPQSQQIVKNLPQPVKVWVFDRNQNVQDQQLLENYQRQGNQFSFQYVDPQAQPGLAQKFGVQNFGEVYLEAGDKRRLVQQVNEQERLSEVRLTNRLQQINSDHTAKVYFLQGHGEHSAAGEQGGLSQAVSVLGEKNYTTQPLNLAQQQAIPKDATVVVVAGPKRTLLDKEVKTLQDYLNQGGSLLLMVDPSVNSGLDGLLKNWGVSLDQRLAIDPSGTGLGLGPAVILVAQYGPHPITKDFGSGISLLRGARPIETTSVAGVEAAPLLLSSPQSWAESDLENQKLDFNPQSDRKGPLTLGVALSRQLKEASPQTKDKPAESRLVVFGNSDFATNGLFEQQLNGDVFLNSVSWLSNQDQQTLSIRPKELKNRRLNLSPQQASLLSLTSLLFVPLIGFGTAALLWWRRR